MSRKKKPEYVAGQDEFLADIAEGLGPAAAAAKVGLPPDDAIERFDAAAITKAEGLALGKIEAMLFKEAQKGKITAMIFWLCNRDPERWKNVASIGKGGEGGGLTALEETVMRLDKEQE